MLREQIKNEGHWDVQPLAAYIPNGNLTDYKEALTVFNKPIVLFVHINDPK